MIFALSGRAHGTRVAAVHAIGDELLVWELLDAPPDDALLAVAVELDSGTRWVARCDRIDFPPGSVAYRHTHPGPGIRFLLHGGLTIDHGDGAPHTYRAGEAWFEGAEDPVLATASATEDTAFVRVLLLPAEWAGKRTIRYVDPADEEKPKLQRPTVFREEPLEL